MKRFSYVAIVAGLNVLDELEQNEQSLTNAGFHLSNESDSDGDGDYENNATYKIYPKVCRRQDNVMPNSRLSETLEDINCDLMKRVDSNVSNYQSSPQTTHRPVSASVSKASSEDLREFSPASPMIPL